MTERIPLDDMTSDQLDQLYDDLDRAEEECRRYAEAESADAAAGSYAGRAERVEETITRVAGLYEQWVKAGPPPLGTPTARWWDRRLVELHNAIHGPAEQPAPRDPCPHCEASSDRVPRAGMGQHIADMHPEVRAGRSKEHP